MPWETRGTSKNRYYYQNKRVNGKAIKLYYGRGAEAHQFVKEQNSARAKFLAERAERQLLRQELQHLQQLHHNSDQLFTILYLISGLFRQERHDWTIRPSSRPRLFLSPRQFSKSFAKQRTMVMP